MKSSKQINQRTKPPRLRGAAFVAFIIGGIGLLFSAAGFVQYRLHGPVTVIPGRDPVSGSEALGMLLILTLTGGFFCICGILLRYCARRLSNKLQDIKRVNIV